MKVLVTGGAGFIGSHLVEALQSQNHEVHVLDNLSSEQLSYLPDQIVHSREDIRSTAVKKLIKREKYDVVFHLAAQADVGLSLANPQLDAEVNIRGTVNILEACRDAGVQKIILASTSAVYGSVRKKVLSEQDQPVPISYYGLSKLTAERYVQIFGRLYGLPYTILRYGNVYGPRQTAKGEGGVIAVFLEKIRAGQPLRIHGDGEQTRDFIYVKDIVRANIAAIGRGDNEIIQVSTAQETSVNQIKAMLAQLHGQDIRSFHTSPRPGDIKHSCLDNRKAKQLLLWHPRYDLFRGLEETYHPILK